MEDKDKRLWELCERTAKEGDPEKLTRIVEELNQFLDASEKLRLENRKPSNTKTSP